jgi:hypothetical protein
VQEGGLRALKWRSSTPATPCSDDVEHGKAGLSLVGMRSFSNLLRQDFRVLKELKSSTEDIQTIATYFSDMRSHVGLEQKGGDDPTVTRFTAPALRRRKKAFRGKRRADPARRHACGSARHPGLDRQATLRKSVGRTAPPQDASLRDVSMGTRLPCRGRRGRGRYEPARRAVPPPP